MLKLGLIALLVGALGCGDDGTEADKLGVGAQCTKNEDCNDDPLPQTCLSFKGGYCGLSPCAHDTDCPDASACIKHTDNVNYCFRICADKPECNRNRDVANEANCSSSVDFVDGAMGRKACVPPS